MIRVQITAGDQAIAEIRITRVGDNPDGTADYSVNFGVEEGKSVSVRQRALFSFPRQKYNALALVRQALATLEAQELLFEEEYQDGETEEHDSPLSKLRQIMTRRE